MKLLTHVKTDDRGVWKPVPVPHNVEVAREPVTDIAGKRYIFTAGVSARSLRFADGSMYHADRGWT
jgi:hypothetical protein